MGFASAVLYLQGGKSISRDLRVNTSIRAREVRLIDEDNAQLGVVSLREALRIAADKGLDLVEVAPTAQPVVCRIMDYGRYKYEQAKRDREARKKQLVIDVKELKFGPNIEDHDFEVRVRNAERFLREGDKLKGTVQFRGRQIQHSALGRQVLMRFAERLRDLAVIEQQPRQEGRSMHILMAPRPEVLQQARAGRSDAHGAARSEADGAADQGGAEENPAAGRGPSASQGRAAGQGAADGKGAATPKGAGASSEADRKDGSAARAPAVSREPAASHDPAAARGPAIPPPASHSSSRSAP